MIIRRLSGAALVCSMAIMTRVRIVSIIDFSR